MPKVILLVNVELEAGKRDQYLAATTELQNTFRGSSDVSYSVYENQGKEKDSFTEMFTFSDMSAYEAFDDREDGDANEIFAKIIGMGKRPPRYTTLLEVQ